jgi:hypothetical protein
MGTPEFDNSLWRMVMEQAACGQVKDAETTAPIVAAFARHGPMLSSLSCFRVLLPGSPASERFAGFAYLAYLAASQFCRTLAEQQFPPAPLQHAPGPHP